MLGEEQLLWVWTPTLTVPKSNEAEYKTNVGPES